MSVRSMVPRPLHSGARRAYLAAGEATASLRLAPQMIMVGASRSGTTSLFRALNEHPQVLRPPVNKGVRYFDLNYGRSWRWYRGHFPLEATARRSVGAAGAPLTWEASGYYLFHPFAVPRIAVRLPEVKIVVMLRDPVERAFSGWKHESARGFEWEDLDRALDLEDERLEGEVDRMARDVTYESFCHRHHSHRGRGEYATQLARVFEGFPREQVHVVQSERFFEHPEREYAALVDFLGLAAHQPAGFAQHNARPSDPMPRTQRARLEAHYAPHNERLEDLLGEPLAWS